MAHGSVVCGKWVVSSLVVALDLRDVQAQTNATMTPTATT